MALTPIKIPLPVGGVCDRGEFDDIFPDEALWMRDCVPGDNSDSIRQRNGFIQQNNAFAHRVVSMFGWRVVGSVGGVAQLANGSLWSLDTARVPVAQIYSSGAATGQDSFAIEAYRNAAGAPRLYFIPNSTTPPQVWDGVTASSSTHTNAPLNCRCLKVWRNRLCFSGNDAFPHRVWYSNVGDPDLPATQYGNNWVDLMDAQTSVFDRIVALAVAGDYLVVLKRMSLWVIYDPVSFNNRRIGDTGGVHHYSVTQSMGRVWYISAPDKLMSTDGVKLKQECPQATFVAGDWANGSNSDLNRTVLAATEDELYVTQRNQDSQREILYIPLKERNQRKEFPVFRWLHRRTINEETGRWTGQSQDLQTVAAFPVAVNYGVTLPGPRVREIVFGGYSSISAGRMYSMWGASRTGMRSKSLLTLWSLAVTLLYSPNG